MTPLGFALIHCAALILAIRGPLLFDPEGHAQRLRRLMFSSDERMRVVGVGMLLLLAAPLLAAALTAPDDQTGRGLVEALGWLVVGGGVFVLFLPGPARRLIEKVMDAADPTALRVVGAFNIAFAFFLVWAAWTIS